MMSCQWKVCVYIFIYVICLSVSLINCRPRLCNFKDTSEPKVHSHFDSLVIGDVGKHLILKCCASRFVKIAWLDGGKPFRPSARYHFNEHGQVLEIEGFLNKKKDVSCQISWPNGSSVSFHTTIKPNECRKNEFPKLVEPVRATEHSVPLGEWKKIDCGFRVACGVEGQIKWYRALGGNNLSEPIRHCVDMATAENDTAVQEELCVIGSKRFLIGAGVRSSLVIRRAQRHHFGQYVCVLAEFSHLNATIMLSEQPKSPVTLINVIGPAIIISAVIFIAVVIVGVVAYRYRLELHLHWKDSFGHWDLVDERDYDAYILYCKREHGGSGKDETFACNVLAKTLTEKYKYRTFIDDRDLMGGGHIVEDYHENIEKSCCLVMVASNDFFQNDWCRDVMQRHVQISKLRKIFVIYQEISDTVFGKDDALRDVFHNTKKIFWPGAKISSHTDSQNSKKYTSKKSEIQFWKQLCSKLPPRRQVSKVQKSPPSTHPKNVKGNVIHYDKDKDNTKGTSITSRRPLLGGSSSTQGSSICSPGVTSSQPREFKSQGSKRQSDGELVNVVSAPKERIQIHQLKRQSTLSDEVFI